MSVFRRVRASRVFIVLAAVGLLVSSGVTAASATTGYLGSFSFGAPTVTRTCASNVATQVSISIPFDASHFRASASATIQADFSNNTTNITGPSYPVGYGSGYSSPITQSFDVPASATPLTNVSIALLDGSGGPIVLESYSLVCTDPLPQFTAPTILAISHPCLGTTTARLSSAPGQQWAAMAAVPGQSSPNPVNLATNGPTTLRVGSALHGAERFVIVGFAQDSTGDLLILPRLIYNAPCVPGHPATSLAGVRSGTRTILTVVERPTLPVAATVNFYRIYAGRRIWVGRAPTSRGKAAVSVPYHAHSSYVAVISPTHYSLSTTTATRYVP